MKLFLKAVLRKKNITAVLIYLFPTSGKNVFYINPGTLYAPDNRKPENWILNTSNVNIMSAY